MYRLLAVPAALVLTGCSFDTVKTVVEPGPIAKHVAKQTEPKELDWAEVYEAAPSIAVACPGDTPADIERALGRDWNSNYRLAQGDATQVVFSTQNDYTDVEVLPRAELDLCPSANAPRSYQPDEVTALQVVDGRLQVVVPAQ